MKKSMLHAAFCVALVVLVGVLAGCATTSSQALSPEQIAASVCPPIQADLVSFQAVFASDITDPNAAKISADIAKAEPVVNALCTAGATVSASSVQAFATTALPALADVVNYLPLSPPQKAAVVTDLTVAELAVGVVGVVEQQIQAEKSSPAPASAVATPAK